MALLLNIIQLMHTCAHTLRLKILLSMLIADKFFKNREMTYSVQKAQKQYSNQT